jgi:hypothetical protein
MNQLRFDENLAIREVLDDIIGMVDRREKLIASVTEQAEETKDDRMKEHVIKLEGLMSDFLALFEPVLSKVRAYADGLKESVSESKAFLKSLVGIIDAGKTIDGTSATLQELESDADEVEEEVRQSIETLERIESLFKRTSHYEHGSSKSRPEDVQDQESTRSTRTIHKGESAGASRSHVFLGPRLSTYESSKSRN